jgi:5-methylcytosine-specific restriction endonuclease McrA
VLGLWWQATAPRSARPEQRAIREAQQILDGMVPPFNPVPLRLIAMSRDTEITTTCGHCGVPFAYRRAGRPRLYCSDQCRLDWRNGRPYYKALQLFSRFLRRRTVEGAELRRVSRATYRHKRRGVVTRRINPSKVFERDRWKCQLCGRKVVQSVGDNRLDEATMDHIIPVALGGAHDWTNIQTACRDCNSRKGASKRGQLRIF